MVFFADFGKTVTDLFKKKDYELHRSLKLKCSSGSTEWTAESCFLPNGDATTKAKYKQTDKRFGAVEIEVPNTKAMKVDYQVPSLMDGLKLNLISENPKASLKAKYEQGQNAAKVCVETAMNNTSKVGLSAEVAREVQGVWVGGEVKYNTEEGLKGYMGGLHYKKSDTQFSLQGNLDVLNVQLHKQYSSSGEVAANYEMNMKTKEPVVSVGGKWALDEKSTAQGFIQSDGNTFLLYKHKLSDRCTLHLGSTFDMNRDQANANVHYKVGFAA